MFWMTVISLGIAIFVILYTWEWHTEHLNEVSKYRDELESKDKELRDMRSRLMYAQGHIKYLERSIDNLQNILDKLNKK